MMHIGDATDMSATSLRFQALTANLWPLTLVTAIASAVSKRATEAITSVSSSTVPGL